MKRPAFVCSKRNVTKPMFVASGNADSKRGKVIPGFLVGAVLLLVYVLSYAPVERLQMSMPLHLPNGVHRPVEWLIDYTPLRKPLFVWADVWGIRNWQEFGWETREHYRKNGNLCSPSGGNTRSSSASP